FRLTSMTTEQRLQELREQAWDKGIVAGRGVDVTGGPIPRRSGYYGQPIVKPPVWTWEIPIYFFIGGFAGMAAVIAFAGLIFRASPRHRFGVLGSFARHLHRSFARRHCDSRMVFASRSPANSFRQCGIGVGCRSAGAARSPCRAAQRPWISRRSDRDSALDLA